MVRGGAGLVEIVAGVVVGNGGGSGNAALPGVGEKEICTIVGSGCRAPAGAKIAISKLSLDSGPKLTCTRRKLTVLFANGRESRSSPRTFPGGGGMEPVK